MGQLFYKVYAKRKDGLLTPIENATFVYPEHASEFVQQAKDKGVKPMGDNDLWVGDLVIEKEELRHSL